MDVSRCTIVPAPGGCLKLQGNRGGVLCTECFSDAEHVRSRVRQWDAARLSGLDDDEFGVLEKVVATIKQPPDRWPDWLDARTLYALSVGLSGAPLHEEELHALYRHWAGGLADTEEGKGAAVAEEQHISPRARLQWCLRKWLEHSLQRERVPTETDEKEIQRHFIGDGDCPTKAFGDLAQDARLMDLMVDRWLLTKRLDLATARHIEFEAAIRPREGRSSLWARLLWHLRHRWTPVVVLVALVLAVICPAVWGLPWLVALAPLLAAAWLVVAFASPHGGRVWAPRLLASVAVGWLALSTTGWAWSLVTAGGSRLQAAVVAALLLLGSWAYLYHAEVFHHSGLSDLRAWWRAGQILLVGACHAVSLGVVGMAAVAPTILERSCARGWGPLWVWPVPVLLLSAFALALGIIAQTLWERDAVTEPL